MTVSKASVGHRLLTSVFGFYFAIAAGATLVQLGLEYLKEKDRVFYELSHLGETLDDSLSQALWHLDDDQVAALLLGVAKVNTVAATRVVGDGGQPIAATGPELPAAEQIAGASSEGIFGKGSVTRAPYESEGTSRTVFEYKVPIRFVDVDNDIDRLVGYLYLYSGHDVVTERVLSGLLIIIVNSLIKTAALWFIFLFFLRRIVVRPLGALTEMAQALDPADHSLEIDEKTLSRLPSRDREDEVSTLANTLIKMRDAIVEHTAVIHQQNATLENRVTERTATLQEAQDELEASHASLLQEMEERRRSDEARAELETRFQQAFKHTPVGMAILKDSGEILEFNASLHSMLWPNESDASDRELFLERIVENERERFRELQDAVSKDRQVTSREEEFQCIATNGKHLNTVITLASVRNHSGVHAYSVLQVQDVTAQRSMTKELEYRANFDGLTGLSNRGAFESALEEAHADAQRRGPSTHLMYMDLDQFKVVNDTSGHAAGDELLKVVSDLLRSIVRRDDVVGRLGGDEFAIILWSCPANVAGRIAEQIRAKVEELRFHWSNETYRIGVSIGVVCVDPLLGEVSDIQQLADAACYEAKAKGRNQVHMLDGNQKRFTLQRGEARWAQRLRDAIEHNYFALFGQKIKPTDKNSTEPPRLEILLRMRDPVNQKLIPPGAFLPAAERYGISVKLDEWVVTNLLRTMVIHQTGGAQEQHVWINLSGTSISDARFRKFLLESVEKSPLSPGTVNFEITETAAIRNLADAGQLMRSLNDLGCQFALDDFGSGLSSFGYLKQLPVDYLKIDGMFVRDIVTDETDRMLVRSIIDTAHTLGIKTIAEYVENDEILEMVTKLGADYVQGFGIHMPELLTPEFSSQAGAERSIAIGESVGANVRKLRPLSNKTSTSSN
jgi:diguanylate cyclase (GGDEF)-like protein/PAS domain S-box-containing protein